MDVEIYKKIADDEINNPQWMETKRFLEVNNIEMINNEYAYERYSIVTDSYRYYDYKDTPVKIECEIIFFYKITNQHYFFGISVDTEKKDVSKVFIRNAVFCYLSAYSENMTLEEMAKLTKLKYSSGVTKGEEIKRGRKGYYQCSCIKYKFTDETSYEIEESLNMLLEELERDKDGIMELVEKTEASIIICKYQYISANAGIEIDRKTIKRLNELNLEINIDMYCVGEYMP